MQTIKKILQPYMVYVKRAGVLFILALACLIGMAIRITSYMHAHPVIVVNEVEKIVEAARPFPAVMARIMKCESNTMHKRDGQVLMVANTNKSVDIGIMQINSVHAKDATKLGYDLTIEADNIAYGLHLYATQGTEPWSASRNCWQ